MVLMENKMRPPDRAFADYVMSLPSELGALSVDDSLSQILKTLTLATKHITWRTSRPPNAHIGINRSGLGYRMYIDAHLIPVEQAVSSSLPRIVRELRNPTIFEELCKPLTDTTRKILWSLRNHLPQIDLIERFHFRKITVSSPMVLDPDPYTKDFFDLNGKVYTTIIANTTGLRIAKSDADSTANKRLSTIIGEYINLPELYIISTMTDTSEVLRGLRAVSYTHLTLPTKRIV